MSKASDHWAWMDSASEDERAAYFVRWRRCSGNRQLKRWRNSSVTTGEGNGANGTDNSCSRD